MWEQPDLEVLAELTRRCLAVDGGLPLAVESWFLESRWLRPGTQALIVSDAASGAVVGAVSVRAGAGGPMITGLVDPDYRGAGVGSRLLDAALAVAASGSSSGSSVPSAASANSSPSSGSFDSAANSGPSSGSFDSVANSGPSSGSSDSVANPGPSSESPYSATYSGSSSGSPDSSGLSFGSAGSAGLSSGVGLSFGGPVVTLESEGVSGPAEVLFAERGFRQVFAEDVMRIELTGNDQIEPGWGPEAVVVEWGDGVAERFHAVYAAAFRERPGFPDTPAEEWIEETADEDDFRADWSLLVSVPRVGDAGFVTASEGWIVQVGVVPAARGTGLGAALIRESLRRASAAGFRESWLCVNVDNPAAGLYRRIGFQDRGRRARFQRPTGESG